VRLKCPSNRVINEAIKGNVPPYYVAQIQWQLWVTGADICDYFCYMDTGEHHLVTIISGQGISRKAIKLRLKEFWISVINDSPPEIEEADYVFIEDDDFFLLEKQYIEIDSKIKVMESTRRSIKLRLIDFSDDGNVRGRLVKIRRSEGRKTIDWKKVCIKYKITEDDLIEYTSNFAPFWVISVK